MFRFCWMAGIDLILSRDGYVFHIHFTVMVETIFHSCCRENGNVVVACGSQNDNILWSKKFEFIHVSIYFFFEFNKKKHFCWWIESLIASRIWTNSLQNYKFKSKRKSNSLLLYCIRTILWINGVNQIRKLI